MGLNRENLAFALPRAGLLVNATSAGMLPFTHITPVDRELLGDHLTVIDIIYNPGKTKLLRDAEQAGARTINGLEMLVWQGALAFERWTGSKAPVVAMRRAAKAALRRHCKEFSDEIQQTGPDCRALQARNDEVKTRVAMTGVKSTRNDS